ncbi:MAG TPA: MarR family transcriptional regulator [Candidatus Saccharimonadales bacterium]|nr:MarR family transcriptional regulator [Candidatus Saccharimonadales bacterium]
MNRNELFNKLEQSLMIIGKEMYQEQAGISGCSPAQNHVLMIIGMHEAIGVKELAENLRVTSGAATQHIDSLEKAGLLTRKLNPNNRREVVVETTKEGKNVFQKVRTAKAQMLSRLFSELSDDELNTLVGLIEKVSRQYVKDGGKVHAKV